MTESLDRWRSLSVRESSITDSFDSAQRNWATIELSPQPPTANVYLPAVEANLESQPHPSPVTRSIPKLACLFAWLLSLATIISSIVSMNWEYFKLKSTPINSTIDNTQARSCQILFTD